MLWFWGRLLTSAEHARCCRDWQLWRSEGAKDERVLYAVRERERERGEKETARRYAEAEMAGPVLRSHGVGQTYLVAKPSCVQVDVAKNLTLWLSLATFTLRWPSQAYLWFTSSWPNLPCVTCRGNSCLHPIYLWRKVICFVGMKSTELGCFRCFRWCSWCLWKALDEEGCMGLVPWCLVLWRKSSWILNDFFIEN
jgi:hypothetical protein